MPFFSMVRSPCVDTRSDTQRFSDSSQKRWLCRFGRKRRRVLLFACETRLPEVGPLPVTSQTRDINLTFAINQLRIAGIPGQSAGAELYTSRKGFPQGAAARSNGPATVGTRQAGAAGR